ncbi:helix-turn-helix domain-containing protein [Paracoccus sp. MC1862]|nr:helix-turn-helix domain-containing protein [Paracoccus sp. MC1862]
MSLPMLTPQQAASRAEVSRGTIMNAIKDRHLVARRDNRNRWQIDPADLSKWLSDRSDIATVKAVTVDSQQVPLPEENLIRIAVLEAELKGKDQRIADLERDRDDWKAQAQELARRDASQVQIDPSSPPRRWWPWRRS